MSKDQTLFHERVDDVPLIIGVANRLRLAELLNRHLGTHGLQQGLNNGQLAVGWLAYILSQGDHRKSTVRDWANGLAHTLEQLLGQSIREVEFSDDRLGALLRRFHRDEVWERIEEELWRASVTVYEMGVDGVRLDATTAAGYHQPRSGGMMQYGHSKDRRPDLAQLKLMAAAAEPTGQIIASDVVSGETADDPLYGPLIRRVRGLLGREGLLYSGDSKMAALATRADIVAHHDYYLTVLPMTGETAEAFASWVEAIVDGEETALLIWDDEVLVGGGYEFTRTQTAPWTDAQGVTQTLMWEERVLVIRSSDLAQSQAARLEQRLQKATDALYALTPAPGRGQRQICDEGELHKAIAAILARYDVAGLLEVEWERETTELRRYARRGRPRPQDEPILVTEVRYVVRRVRRNEATITAQRHRLGWRVLVTNAPAAQLSLTAAVLRYRGGWVLERDFHLIKDRPLGLSPLFVWKDDQIKGLTRLLTLALRLLTLIETQVRQGLQRENQTLSGLYPGQPRRQTDRPTGIRLLQAFSRAQITLTRLRDDSRTVWHISPLSALHLHILRYLGLAPTLYSALAPNTS